MSQDIRQIVIRFQAVQKCCFRYTVYGRTGICALDTFSKQPVPASNGKILDRTFGCLSSYKDKVHYPQDIFILIFSDNALKFSSLIVKDEDNIII